MRSFSIRELLILEARDGWPGAGADAAPAGPCWQSRAAPRSAVEQRVGRGVGHGVLLLRRELAQKRLVALTACRMGVAVTAGMVALQARLDDARPALVTGGGDFLLRALGHRGGPFAGRDRLHDPVALGLELLEQHWHGHRRCRMDVV